jgi:hypothetical protein
MANEVENATGGLEAKAVELIDQLTEGLKSVAPQMADVTLAAIQFQGVMDLISGVAFVAIGSAVVYGAYRAAKDWAIHLPDEKLIDMWSFPKVIAMVGCCVAGTGGAVGAVINLCLLFSWSMWAAIIDPRLALALRVINKLM